MMDEDKVARVADTIRDRDTDRHTAPGPSDDKLEEQIHELAAKLAAEWSLGELLECAYKHSSIAQFAACEQLLETLEDIEGLKGDQDPGELIVGLGYKLSMALTIEHLLDTPARSLTGEVALECLAAHLRQRYSLTQLVELNHPGGTTNGPAVTLLAALHAIDVGVLPRDVLGELRHDLAIKVAAERLL